jgi:hypothetical protein
LSRFHLTLRVRKYTLIPMDIDVISPSVRSSRTQRRHNRRLTVPLSGCTKRIPLACLCRVGLRHR